MSVCKDSIFPARAHWFTWAIRMCSDCLCFIAVIGMGIGCSGPDCCFYGSKSDSGVAMIQV